MHNFVYEIIQQAIFLMMEKSVRQFEKRLIIIKKVIYDVK